MTLIDDLTEAARLVIHEEIALLDSEIAKAIRKRSTKATIALGEELHERVTQHYARKIARTMKDVTGIEEAVEAAKRLWYPTTIKAAGDGEDDDMEVKITPLDSSPIASGPPDIGPIPSDVALGAIASNVGFNLGGIQNTLESLYGDAGLVGAGMGAAQMGTIPEGNGFATVLEGIDWAKWHPGDLKSAQYVANGRLQDILDDLDITIRGITDSAMERMSTVLANGLNEGLAPKTIAQNMKDIIADPKRAEVIARTETARAQGASNLNIYEENGTREWTWHANLGACALCLGLEADSPYPVGGGPAFPGHPNCRCQPLPYVEGL